MSLQIEIIRATEFVRVGAEGHFDLPASKAALATVAAACRKRGVQHAVIDLRALQPGPKPVFSPADLVELVKTFPAVGFTRRLRLAVLYRSDPHKRARLFAFLSTMHGWDVRAFGDFEPALLWLSSGQETSVKTSRGAAEKTIPIQMRGPGAGAAPRTASRLAHAEKPSAARRQARAAASRNRVCARMSGP